MPSTTYWTCSRPPTSERPSCLTRAFLRRSTPSSRRSLESVAWRSSSPGHPRSCTLPGGPCKPDHHGSILDRHGPAAWSGSVVDRTRQGMPRRGAERSTASNWKRQGGSGHDRSGRESRRRVHLIVTVRRWPRVHHCLMVLLACVDDECGGVGLSIGRSAAREALDADAPHKALCSLCGRSWSMTAWPAWPAWPVRDEVDA